MIIGLFNDSFPPIMDGVANVFMNYARELTNKGDRCVAVIPEMVEFTKDLPYEIMSFKSFKLPKRNEYRWGLGMWDASFWRQIKDIPFDVLHTHCPFSAHQVAKVIRRRRDIPLISTFHSKYKDDFAVEIKSEAVVRDVIKLLVSQYKNVDEVWSVNKASAEVLKGYGYTGDIYIMENGCDIEPGECTDEIRNEVKQRFSLTDAPLLMYIGQHTVQKNMPMLIDALKVLSDAGHDFQMLLIGDGVLREDMQKKVLDYNIQDKVTFAGIVRDRQLVRKVYLASEAMLFPSLYDTSSLVPREAAACFTPTVFAEGSSTAENITDMENGFLAGGSPEEYAKKVELILENEQIRKRVAKNAHDTLYKSWGDAVEKARERYLYVIDKKKTRAKMAER